MTGYEVPDLGQKRPDSVIVVLIDPESSRLALTAKRSPGKSLFWRFPESHIYPVDRKSTLRDDFLDAEQAARRAVAKRLGPVAIQQIECFQRVWKGKDFGAIFFFIARADLWTVPSFDDTKGKEIERASFSLEEVEQLRRPHYHIMALNEAIAWLKKA
ncbi:MAG: hypothetical protein PHV99_00225 [Candidatus Pacebacteria bacterium]|nr:hypothetical protein [Candidatus Paceibacterota bacterium]